MSAAGASARFSPGAAIPRWTRPLVCWLAASWTLGSPAAEAVSRRQLAAIFEPERTTQVALAPDGGHLAYTVHEGRVLKLVVADVDHPEQKATLPIGTDEMANIFTSQVTFPARVTWMQWSDAHQLVYGLSVRESGPRRRDELRAVEADGKNDRLLLDAVALDYTVARGGSIPRYPRVIGFPAGDPGNLIFEAAGNSDRSAISRYSLELQTAKLHFLGEQDKDGRMIYDQQGHPRLLETPRLRIYQQGPPMRGAPGSPPIRVPPPPPEIVRQTYQLHGPEPAGRWQDIDSLPGKAAGPGFSHGDADYFGPRSIPLAFGADPEILYFASNAGRDTFGLYALDLRTKQRTDFALEDPRFDLVQFTSATPESALVFDRQHQLAGVRLGGVPSHTRWIDPKLTRLQGLLDEKFPARDVELVDWDAARRRVVALVSNPGEPGRYFIFDDAGPGRLSEVLRRAPWLPAETLSRAVPFEFVTPAGVALAGTVTLPRQPRLNPPPLIVLCPDLPDWRDRGGFARDAEAFAAAGFMVAKVEYRGLSGFGTAYRDAAKAGFDQVPIGDIRATIDWLATHHPFDHRRVALIGEGFGGYLALRALELYPEEFRCAVTFNAPTDLAWWATSENGRTGGGGGGRGGRGGRGGTASANVASPEVAARRLFFGGDKARLEEISALDHAGAITKPVFIIQEDRANLWPSHGTDLRDRLKKQDGGQVEFADLDNESDRSTPEGSLKTYQRVIEFLIAGLYNFDVKIGPTREVP